VTFFHGCTVHYVTAELDAGKALLQGVVKVAQNDNVNTLAKRA
jgi:phosphoribosylglycinamide formyltransferase-1